MGNPQLNAAMAALDLAKVDASNLTLGLNDAITLLAEAAAMPPPPPVLRIVNADFTGKNDATADFQVQLDGAGVVYVPAGDYLIDAALSANVRSDTILIMHADARLIAKPNALRRYDVLKAEDAANIQIIGGSIMGDRFAHDYSSGGTHEWGMGGRIRRCRNVVVRDLTVEDCTGDGISASGEGLAFHNVISNRNRRQGMSLYAGRDYVVSGGRYINTGNHVGPDGMVYEGASPKSGIDIEPDKGDVSGVLITGVEFSKYRSGLLMVSRTDAASEIRGVVVLDCIFMEGANGINAENPSGRIVEFTARRNKFYRNTGSAIRLNDSTNAVIGHKTDASQANTFVGMKSREAFTKPGIASLYDIQLRDKATAEVGINNYA